MIGYEKKKKKKEEEEEEERISLLTEDELKNEIAMLALNAIKAVSYKVKVN